MDDNSIISIDGWQIDASSCRIARNGNEKKLEPRSMELLLYLIDHPNQVVTREEIEENVWQGRVVGYDALSASIAKIRKAFEDSSKQPRVIETIPTPDRPGRGRGDRIGYLYQRSRVRSVRA
jgi:DNA-binding winged helix-turn-helix (wHTH) protein